MPTTLNIPDGAHFLESADQWSEVSYTVRGNRIFSTSIDRKDPQYEEGAGVSIEAFLADPTVKEWSKTWIRELVAKHST